MRNHVAKAGVCDIDMSAQQRQGDFSVQCRYAYEKIGKLLAAHGGKISDVVNLVTYVTDIKDRDAMNKCRADAFKGGPLIAGANFPVSGQPEAR